MITLVHLLIVSAFGKLTVKNCINLHDSFPSPAIVQVHGASYSDTIDCDEFPGVANYSSQELEAMARR